MHPGTIAYLVTRHLNKPLQVSEAVRAAWEDLPAAGHLITMTPAKWRELQARFWRPYGPTWSQEFKN